MSNRIAGSGVVGLAIVLFVAPGTRSFAQDDGIDIQSGVDVSDALVATDALRWVPGQIIVKYKTTPRGDDPRLGTMGFSEHLRVTGGGEYIYALSPARSRSMSVRNMSEQAESAVERMQGQPDVEYAQLNYVAHIVRIPNDPGYPQQWHYRNNGNGNDESPGGINLPDAWDRTTGATTSVVAVIDTGILPNHPDITGSQNLLDGFDMITDNFTANDGDGRDNDPTDSGDAVGPGDCGPGSRPSPDSWHGTHVAGTVGVGRTDNGAGIAGVNWNSRVVPLRALGRCGGSIADINDAIRWSAGLAVPGTPQNQHPAKVINMSLGAGAPCSASPSTQAAIDDVVAAGVTVVVAAGNEASDAQNSFPASCNNVITVAASDFNGELVRRYSNFGNVVDIMAPGGDVTADDDNDGNPDGVLSMVNGGYAYYNGTSMAAPHVAGVAALLLAQDPGLTPQAVENLIVSNAIPRSNTQCPLPCGAGLLNADINASGSTPPATLAISVNPTEFELDEGESATLNVNVTLGGAPADGITVRLRSSDDAVATISPASAVTNSMGQVQVQVSAGTRGDTELAVSIPGQTQTMTVNVDVRVVPAMGIVAALMLALLIGFFGFRRLGVARR